MLKAEFNQLQKRGVSMKEWAVYALIAAVAYGLSAIPLKLVVSRGSAAGLSEAVLICTCLGSLIGASIYVISSGKLLCLASSVDKQVLIYGGGAGLISIVGSIAVIRALGVQSSTVPNVMALVNTSVFFAMLFSTLILGRQDGASEMRAIMGTALIFVGAVIICA
jgi:uncharacterized membrane protein